MLKDCSKATTPSLGTTISTGTPFFLSATISGKSITATVTSPRVSMVDSVPLQSACWKGSSFLISTKARSMASCEPP